MKILIINGSPRKGNTKFALKLIEDTIREKYRVVSIVMPARETVEIVSTKMIQLNLWIR